MINVTSDPEASGLIYVGNGDDVVGVGFLRNGVANVRLDGTALVPGAYPLDVYYGGSGTFDNSQTTVDLTVGKAATTTAKFSVAAPKVVVKKTQPYVTFSVTANGFTVDSGSFTVQVGAFSKTVTVADGKAKVRLPAFTTTGTKTINGSYLGSDLANPSNGSFTLKVVRK